MIGAPCELMIDPRDRAKVSEVLKRILQGERQRVEMRYLAAGGETRVGLLTADALYDNGVVVGGLGIMRDTTDDTARREANAERAHRETVDSLLANVANEVSDPINALLSIADSGASSPTIQPEARRTLEQIRDEARRASRVVSDLLESVTRPSEDGAAATSALLGVGGAAGVAPSRVARSVLIVEDEDALRAVVGRYFQRQGYEVVTVPGGAEALQKLEARSFGAVLLDLRLDGMSGEDTYREMLRLHPEQAKRVLFITGDSRAFDDFLRGTGRTVVAKPFVLADLEQRVAGLIRTR
jgi:CheY-like chemotaxis protein